MIRYKSNGITSRFAQSTEADNDVEMVSSVGKGRKRICIKYSDNTVKYGLTTDTTASTYSPIFKISNSTYYFGSVTNINSLTTMKADISYIKTINLSESDKVTYTSTYEYSYTSYTSGSRSSSYNTYTSKLTYTTCNLYDNELVFTKPANLLVGRYSYGTLQPKSCSIKLSYSTTFTSNGIASGNPYKSFTSQVSTFSVGSFSTHYNAKNLLNLGFLGFSFSSNTIFSIMNTISYTRTNINFQNQVVLYADIVTNSYTGLDNVFESLESSSESILDSYTSNYTYYSHFNATFKTKITYTSTSFSKLGIETSFATFSSSAAPVNSFSVIGLYDFNKITITNTSYDFNYTYTETKYYTCQTSYVITFRDTDYYSTSSSFTTEVYGNSQTGIVFAGTYSVSNYTGSNTSIYSSKISTNSSSFTSDKCIFYIEPFAICTSSVSSNFTNTFGFAIPGNRSVRGNISETDNKSYFNSYTIPGVKINDINKNIFFSTEDSSPVFYYFYSNNSLDNNLANCDRNNFLPASKSEYSGFIDNNRILESRSYVSSKYTYTDNRGVGTYTNRYTAIYSVYGTPEYGTETGTYRNGYIRDYYTSVYHVSEYRRTYGFSRSKINNTGTTFTTTIFDTDNIKFVLGNRYALISIRYFASHNINV